MRISFTKILLIVFIAAALGLLINFLQPDGLPLFNENRNESSQADEKLNPAQPVNHAGENMGNIQKQDYNKIAVEKNKVQINEDLLPEYHYKSDSTLSNSDTEVAAENTGKSSDDVNLSNLTTDVFNQPRLISLSQAYELYRNKILFIDARNAEEFADGHIAGAINLPLFSLDQYSDKLKTIDKTEPVVTYCEGADCDMSIRLGNELFAKGFKKVFVFFGGWEEWKKADYPIVSATESLQLN
jgi:rhodanese-related sulfurtransferase